MNEALRVIKNTTAMSAGKILMTFGNTILTIIIARQLSVAGFGAFISLTTLWDLFRGLVASGLSVLVVREIAKDREKTSLFLSNGMLITLILTVLSWAGVYLTASTDAYAETATQAIVLIALALIPGTAIVLYESILIAFERMEFITGMTVVETVVRVSLSLLFLWQDMGILGLLAAMFISQSIMVVGYHFLVTRYLHKLSWQLDFRFARTLARDGAILTIQNGLATIGSRFGVLALTFLAGNVVVGLYGAAGKLLRLSLFIDAYKDAIFPNMARLTDAPDKDFSQILEKSFKYMLMAFLPIVMGLSVLADKFIFIFYSAEYSGAIVLLQIMAWGLLIKIFVPMLSRALIALGRQDLSLRVTTVSLVIDIVLTVISIPLWGVMGMLLTTWISDVITLAMLHRYLVTRNVKIRYKRIIARPALAGAVMGIATYLIRDANLALVIVVSAAVYVAAMLLFRVITPGEWGLIQQTLRAGIDKVGQTLAGNA